jgi:hypothetical protein
MSSSAEFAVQVAQIRKRLDPGVLAAIREAHDALDFGCSAHSEGLACCVDWLVSDDGPELHQISREHAYERRQG